MQLLVYTQSGSVYFLNREAMLWGRCNSEEKTRAVRTNSGTLTEWPSVLSVGERMRLVGPPFDSDLDPKTSYREIITTPVTRIVVRPETQQDPEMDGAE